MNPDNGQLSDQPESASSLPTPTQPAQVQPPIQSADDPLGPRPVPPVYDLSQQQMQPTAQDDVGLQTEQYGAPEDVESAALIIPDSTSQYDATKISESDPPTETLSPEPQPMVANTSPAQPLSIPTPPQAQVQHVDTSPVFAAPPQGNQSVALAKLSKGPKSKKIMLLVIGAIGGLLAIGVMALLVTNLFGGSKVKLQKYSDDNFSISYPVNMVVKKSEGSVEIVEGDDKEGSKISIMRPLTAGTTPANETIKLFKEQIIQQDKEDDEVTITSSQETKINGAQALVVTGEEKSSDGIKVSKLVLIASSDDKTTYLLGFENHLNGIDIIGGSDAIIKSFIIKS